MKEVWRTILQSSLTWIVWALRSFALAALAAMIASMFGFLFMLLIR